MWLSQIARASTNTTFQTVVRRTARATSNQTATLNGGTVTEPGQTALVNAQNVLVNFVPNGAQLSPAQADAGFRLVPPVTTVGGVTPGGNNNIRNPEQYVTFNDSVYTQQVGSQGGGNEYVFTNGIDFGVEIKY